MVQEKLKIKNIYKNKKDVQDAHEAIRPISLDRTPEMVKPYLSPENYKLYKVVTEKGIYIIKLMNENLTSSSAVVLRLAKDKFEECTSNYNFDLLLDLFENFDIGYLAEDSLNKKLKTMFSFCISLGLHYLCTHFCTHYQQINKNKIWKRTSNGLP